MGQWLHENYQWLIPVVFGSLFLLNTLNFVAQRRREDDEERRIIEKFRRRLMEMKRENGRHRPY